MHQSKKMKPHRRRSNGGVHGVVMATFAGAGLSFIDLPADTFPCKVKRVQNQIAMKLHVFGNQKRFREKVSGLPKTFD